MSESYKTSAIIEIINNADFLRTVFDSLTQVSDVRYPIETRMSILEDLVDRLEGENGPNKSVEKMREIFRSLANLRTDGLI